MVAEIDDSLDTGEQAATTSEGVDGFASGNTELCYIYLVYLSDKIIVYCSC